MANSTLSSVCSIVNCSYQMETGCQLRMFLRIKMLLKLYEVKLYKNMARVFTKEQSSSNVLNETIAIKSHIPPLKKYSTVISSNVTLIMSEEIDTWEKFFQVLGTSVKDLDGSNTIDVSTTLNKPGKLVRYVIGNGSTGL